MKRKTEMILKGIKLIGNIGKAVAVGRTVYGVVKFGMKVRKGAKVASDVKEKSSKMLNVVKNIGTVTEVAATATQVVSDLSSDARNLTGAVKKRAVKKTEVKSTTKTSASVSKKKNR